MSKPDPGELASLRKGKVYVAGHRGMVGSALVRRLRQDGCENLLLKTRAEVDLEDQRQARDLILAEKPDYVFLAAARVGGIHANNSFPAQFIYSNLMIAANVINAAWEAGVKGLMYLGSSCIYPRNAPQPIRVPSCVGQFGSRLVAINFAPPRTIRTAASSISMFRVRPSPTTT